MLSTRSSFLVKWINRNANKTAHSFARVSHDFESPYYWDELLTLWKAFLIFAILANNLVLVSKKNKILKLIIRIYNKLN